MLLYSRLNLSRHKSLRTLRLFATMLCNAEGLTILNSLLSTIPSSPQLDVVIVYDESEFSRDCAMQLPGHAGYKGEPTINSSYTCIRCNWNLCRFNLLNEAHGNRNFRLVLCAEASGEALRITMRALEIQVEAYQDGEILNSLLSESSVVSTAPCFWSGYEEY
jgi:hypothetical protein